MPGSESVVQQLGQRSPRSTAFPPVHSIGCPPLFVDFKGIMQSSDFPSTCLPSLRFDAFPGRSTLLPAEVDGISQVPFGKLLRMRRVFDCVRLEEDLRVASPSMWPSASLNSVGASVGLISQLNTWPAASPVNASPCTLRCSAHDSGPE